MTAKLRLVTVLIISIMACGCEVTVHTGLDNVDSHSSVFDGKRVGIVTNHTAWNANGEHIAGVFQQMPNVTVTALFGPEHGIKGLAQDGRKITDDKTADIPVYSLYGQRLKPTKEMLQNIDVLVFDIQDIGARFYTYISTMSYAMEVAAENKITFVVLDRPNPINGVTVEGNILEKDYATFVGLHPIPVRHGMTAGELAKMFNDQGWLAGGVKADLKVIPVTGWKREMWYDQTHLEFIKPSPNMTTLQTATVYPGLCLLEGTNVSEGRGTEEPFIKFGAPWIEPTEFCKQLNHLKLPGLSFETTSFTPESSKHKGVLCKGARITITDRDAVQAYWSGIQIVDTIHRMYPDKLEWKIRHFDRLCGTEAVRKTIIAGESLVELRRSWKSQLDEFMKIRKKYLLYK